MRTVTQRDLESVVEEIRRLANETLTRAKREPDSMTCFRLIGQSEGLDRAAELVESFYNV